MADESSNVVTGSGDGSGISPIIECEYTYEAQGELFCGFAQFCDSDCTAYTEEQIMSSINKYFNFPGCSDLQVCGMINYDNDTPNRM